MSIVLEHVFADQCYDLKGLLDECNSINEYMKRLMKQAATGSGPTGQMDPNTYKGDGLELFSEALIKLMGTHPHIGISDYHPIGKEDDVGVDGYGYGVNGRPATVQVKFRSNTVKDLTGNEDHLTNFLGASVFVFNVEKEDRDNMLIITTANDIHFFTREKMLHNRVRCLGIKQLEVLVNNNLAFWDSFRQAAEWFY